MQLHAQAVAGSYDFYLHDLTTGALVWKGRASGSGRKWVTRDRLRRRVARQLTAALSDAGLVFVDPAARPKVTDYGGSD